MSFAAPWVPGDDDVEHFVSTAGRLQQVSNYTLLGVTVDHEAPPDTPVDMRVLVRLEGVYDDPEGFEPVLHAFAISAEEAVRLAVALIRTSVPARTR